MDKIVSNVIWKYMERSKIGQDKYKTNLERTDLSTLEWINHLQEELMDATLYLERLKSELQDNRPSELDLEESADGRRKYFVNQSKWFR
jgi:hypothetical protein